MKRIGFAVVLMFALTAVPCLAQHAAPKASPPAAKPAPAPKDVAPAVPQLTAEQRDAIREKVVALQANLIQQYQYKDQYATAQKSLTDQATTLNKEIEDLIAADTKGVDSAEWVLDRNTLKFISTKTPQAPK